MSSRRQYQFPGAKILLFLIVVFLLTATLLLKPVFTSWINSIHHQRKIMLSSINSVIISFYLPSYLHTQKELQNNTSNELFTNITKAYNLNLYTLDKRVNKYYYQTKGIDLLFILSDPSSEYLDNIPFKIAKKMILQIPSGKAIIYIYPGADGNGHGRGKLGSVHQGQINLEQSKNFALAFYCYDHSSGAKVSKRCDQTVQMLLKTVHVENNIFSIFLK